MALKQVHVSVCSNGVVEISVIRDDELVPAGTVKSAKERSKRFEQHTKKSAAARLKALAQEIENAR